jgi:hypothetical protein
MYKKQLQRPTPNSGEKWQVLYHHSSKELLGAELGAMRFVRRLGMRLGMRLRMRLGMMGVGRVDGLLERWLRLGLGLWLWLRLWLRLGVLLRVRLGMRLGMGRVDGLLERWLRFWLRLGTWLGTGVHWERENGGTRASGRSSSLEHGSVKGGIASDEKTPTSRSRRDASPSASATGTARAELEAKRTKAKRIWNFMIWMMVWEAMNSLGFGRKLGSFYIVRPLYLVETFDKGFQEYPPRNHSALCTKPVISPCDV